MVEMNKPTSQSPDLVAVWDVPLSDRVHRIEFEHGTTTGKRVIRIDGKEILRKEWMFKLVGGEIFEVGSGCAKCEIIITASFGFSYEYTLLVNGKQLTKFKEKQTKIMKTWLFNVQGQDYRVVLEKDSLDVWVNGRRMETRAEFVEDGTEIQFDLSVTTPSNNKSTSAGIRTVSSGNKKEGIIYSLFVDGQQIPESID